MRKAIITELMEITEFSNRVKETGTAPSVYITPYCVVKMTGENPVIGNKYGSPIDFQVYIYGSPSSFEPLDDLEMKVRKKLHLQTLSTDESPARFFTPEYVRTLPDWVDDIRKLFVKMIYFTIPLSRM